MFLPLSLSSSHFNLKIKKVNIAYQYLLRHLTFIYCLLQHAIENSYTMRIFDIALHSLVLYNKISIRQRLTIVSFYDYNFFYHANDIMTWKFTIIQIKLKADFCHTMEIPCTWHARFRIVPWFNTDGIMSTVNNQFFDTLVLPIVSWLLVSFPQNLHDIRLISAI